MSDQALGLQLAHRLEDPAGVEHIAGRQRRRQVASGWRNRIVQLQQCGFRDPQSSQAALDRLADDVPDRPPRQLFGHQPHLGRDVELTGRVQIGQGPSDPTFRTAVSITGRGVDPVDPVLECPGQHLALSRGIVAGHQFGDRPGSECENRNIKAGPAEWS